MDYVTTTDVGFFGAVFSAISFILLCVIAHRLKKIINTTFKSSTEPGVSYYAEAMACEKIGDTKAASKNYYLAYWALEELNYKKFKWNGSLVYVTDIKKKIGLFE